MSDANHDLQAELLRAVAQGDELAFAELYRQTGSRLYGVAHRLLRTPEAASDAVQEAFARIWSDATRFDAARGHAIHWMVAIQRNICIDMIRRQAARPVVDIDIAELEIPIEPPEEGSGELRRCIQQLATLEARLIAMSVHQGLSHNELAVRLKMPLGTIKSTIRRALIKLRMSLEPREPHAAPA